MADALIRNVSDTAFMVATYRAMETERSDALFKDPLAEELAGERGRKIVADLPRRASFGCWIVAIRTCIIDDFIRSALSDGVDTVLNLGAGLDTRPYRMDLPATLRWIEVDQGHIIDFKEDRLRDQSPRCRLERVKLDLAEAGPRRRLFAEIAGESRKILVLTEGVVPYLETKEVGQLADELRAHPAFHYWILDYLSPTALRYRRRTTKRMRMQNAPFKFEPGDFFGFFEKRRWRSKEIRYIPEEADRLTRPLPLPFILQVWLNLRNFIVPSRREAFRKSMAYVLLEPFELS